jgi:predicted Rossmann fold flavoprotein
MTAFDILILGAGPSGLVCAIEAAKRGRRVLVLDHSTRVGNKLRVSGGGSCNFTNLDLSADHYVSANPHFCKSALGRYTPEDFLDRVKKRGIPVREKKAGQMFCEGPAQQIVDMLLSEASVAGVELRQDAEVLKVEKGKGFTVYTSVGDFESEKLVVATGGLSHPKLGASSLGYELAKKFGHKIVPTAPALDGFLFGVEEDERFGDLAGLAVDALVTCDDKEFKDPILFTHRGLSGPAAMQASLYWNESREVTVDFAPDTPDGVLEYLVKTKSRGSLQSPATMLARILPNRLAERFAQAYLPGRSNLAQTRSEELVALAKAISTYRFIPNGTVGYSKAEVTKGGVDTRELSSKTMESSKTPGLYFIGEVVDVTGQLGGYNLQWAWSSGWAAGQAV